MDVKDVNDRGQGIVSKIFDIVSDFIHENSEKFYQNYVLVEVDAGKILKSQKKLYAERKEWIGGIGHEEDCIGCIYLQNTG